MQNFSDKENGNPLIVILLPFLVFFIIPLIGLISIAIEYMLRKMFNVIRKIYRNITHFFILITYKVYIVAYPTHK